MTTLELIEKHGIGHNCLSDAYELGRQDAERDFQNSDYWNDYLQKIISDAKAEWIEEFREKINKYLNESTDFADFVVTDTAIDYVLDEMKGGAENE